MTLASFFRELYSLETLDTRFTNSPSTPLKAVNENTSKPGERDRQVTPADLSPSRWKTPEFYFYAFVFLFCVPQMYWAVVEVSQRKEQQMSYLVHALTDMRQPTRRTTQNTSIYCLQAGFSVEKWTIQMANMPAFETISHTLSVLIILHPLLRRGYERLSLPGVLAISKDAKTKPGNQAAECRLRRRLSFDFWSALVYITALNGSSVLKILLILFINFKIATAFPRNSIPVVTWIFNIVILFANELAQGYRYSALGNALSPFAPAVTQWCKALDSYGGLNPRWEVLFKITILRMISFNFDRYGSLGTSRAGSPVEKKRLDPAALSEKDRVIVPSPAWASSSFRTYIAYILYPPLYLAGPILTFNDYTAQCTYRAPSVTTRRTVLYGVRFLLTLFCMEFLLYTTYVVAISKVHPDWSTFTPFQLSMLAYLNLHIIWLKLMIPWRFFRLWALVDDIDPPENMIRCMSDNYSALGFWRSWHRSFNRWTVRFVYTPLGGGPGGEPGRVRGILNMLAVFTFVALWHALLRTLMFQLGEYQPRTLRPSFRGRGCHLCRARPSGNISGNMLMVDSTRYTVADCNTKCMVFSFAQMIAHHTRGGCPLRPGDIMATGTMSGGTKSEEGCFLELTRPDGENAYEMTAEGPSNRQIRRSYLEDGDIIEFSAQIRTKDGAGNVGFGLCRGEVLPAN
ncbi:glycerol transporter [Exophiala xenobiotica]|nr:glycerol transporter [Exophiala xenobiotica]